MPRRTTQTTIQTSRADRIIARVRSIPKGSVCTYGDIDPSAPRLVGRLLAQHYRPATDDSADVDVPWHRVVRADGSLPVGTAQLARLLEDGVPIRGGRVDFSRMETPATEVSDERELSAFERVGTAPEHQPRRRVSHAEAARILAARDPVIARLLAEAGPPRIRRPREPHFAALLRAIVYQQLAAPAATAIHGRLLGVLGGDPGPGALIALPDETLRAAGLSANKAASLRDLATKVLEGTVVLSPRGLGRQSDEEVAARLTAVRGIGPWTADMFLLFQLRRLDVWPAGDLGVRRGYGLAWNVSMPSARALQPLGEPYRPYRSIAAWYCWRAAELYAGAEGSVLTR
jgi:DNA-3-methyladenine glycosylase II